MRIIIEPKELIANYTAKKQNNVADWKDYVAFGLVNNNDELVAGVVFNGYVAPNIVMHISADIITPGFICTVMHYAFEQCKCKRITGIIHKNNKRSRRFASHLGAKLEGIMREATDHGDLCIYGLMKLDAQKWLQAKYLKKLEASWVS